MALKLKITDLEKLNGLYGPATKMAMSILVRMAEISLASEICDITGAHIDSTVYIGDAGLVFAERLASLGAKVAVPTTLSVSRVDEHHWKEWAVPAHRAKQAQYQMAAYQSTETIPTWTCAPYQTSLRPVFGQQLAWEESNAIVFANSVIGARSERYRDMFDIYCAITGSAPAIGLHLTENRGGKILLRILDIPVELQSGDDFFSVLDHFLGKISFDCVAVIDGMIVTPTEDQLKALGAAAASSVSVALFHIVGMTPEVNTADKAFQANPPQEIIDITMDILRESRKELTHVEAIREGTSPIAIITTATDFFFALAAVVAGELYGKSFPLISL
jgi:predicted aconitase